MIILLTAFNYNLFSESNYSKIYKILTQNKIDLTQYKVLLIIPEPSCHGCFTLLKNNLDKFVKNKDLKVVNLFISEKLGYPSLITEINYYDNYKEFDEVFGITAFILNKGIFTKKVPIIPDNIDNFIKIISKSSLNKKDIKSIEKLNN
jgi:hypothetical protein